MQLAPAPRDGEATLDLFEPRRVFLVLYRNMSDEDSQKLTLRRIVVAFVPLLALIGMIVVGVTVFGRDVGDGPSQVSLIFATALAALLAGVVGRVPWSALEQGITSSIAKAGVSIMILLLIGMLSGATVDDAGAGDISCRGLLPCRGLRRRRARVLGRAFARLPHYAVDASCAAFDRRAHRPAPSVAGGAFLLRADWRRIGCRPAGSCAPCRSAA